MTGLQADRKFSSVLCCNNKQHAQLSARCALQHRRHAEHSTASLPSWHPALQAWAAQHLPWPTGAAVPKQ